MRQLAAKINNRYGRKPKALRGLVWAVVLLLVGYVVEDVRGRASLTAFHRKWNEAGLSIKWRDIFPAAETPEHEDFRQAPIVAEFLCNQDKLSKLRKASALCDPIEGYRRDRKAAKLTGPKHGTSMPIRAIMEFPGTDTREDAQILLQLLKPWTEPLSELENAAQRPHCRKMTPIDPDSLAIDLQALSGFNAPPELHYRGLACLTLGQPDHAARDLRLLLRLGVHARQNYFVWDSEGMCALSASGILWEGLDRNAWSDDHLWEFADAFGDIDLPGRFPRHVREYCSLIELEVRRDWKPFSYGFAECYAPSAGNIGRLPGMVLLFLAPRGSIDLTIEARCRPLLECLATPELNIQHIRDLLKRLERPSIYELSRSDGVYKSLDMLIFAARDAVGYQRRVDVARLAIALEQYRRSHGEYPSTLAELVPSYLPSVPEDRFAPGQPILYQRTPGARYRLSSSVDNEALWQFTRQE